MPKLRAATQKEFNTLCQQSTMHGILKAIQFYNQSQPELYPLTLEYFKDAVPQTIPAVEVSKFWNKYKDFNFNR